jgi:hypothetical protein
MYSSYINVQQSRKSHCSIDDFDLMQIKHEINITKNLRFSSRKMFLNSSIMLYTKLIVVYLALSWISCPEIEKKRWGLGGIRLNIWGILFLFELECRTDYI